jgi:hypothetical protein
MNPKLAQVQYLSPHKLSLIFTKKETKVFDFSCYLIYPIYKILNDETFVKKQQFLMAP